MSDTFARTETERERLALIGEMADSFKPLAQAVDQEGGFAFESAEKLRASGYTKWPVPRAYGGEGMTVYEMVLYQERIAMGDPALALAIGWHVSTVAELAAKKPWSEDKLAPFLRAVAEGKLMNRAATEKGTGSPSRGGKMQTTAEQHGEGYVVRGRKTFTSLAPVLDLVVVNTTLIEGDTEGPADFLIPMNAPGVSVDPVWNMMGMRGTGSHDLVLDDVILPAEALVYRAPPGKRGGPANPYLLHVPACYLGAALAAREEALAFAASYQPNSLDRPILHLPHIGTLIGEIDIELAAARHFMYSVAARWEHVVADEAAGIAELGAVKVFAIRTALSVADKALRITGAHGLAQTHPLQRLFRDIRFGLSNPPMEDAVQRLYHQQALRETGQA
ncbi:acyl-CoA dehydrogenase family protein [Cohnella hashimotonis]|uniref:Acyl-CoA dehydrogenase family protein n=1 Tax=Cohnella hashimotonis TaxID=2826895 RepID=A0ABT6TS38_9BACL|nr:acyl-CoA dehydrogenase family protein [Cohnella hashimotonis]MDI4649150.1 acyl-CoA dehydrogenase family protein [Cohnella hashimotonis]